MSWDCVIGGTGMLRPVVEALLDCGRHVALLARGTAGFRGLHRDCLELVTADYSDPPRFRAVLDELITQRGVPDRTVAWIHDNVAPGAMGDVVAALGRAGDTAVLLEVVASVDESPAAVAARQRAAFAGSRIGHRQVVLGYRPGPPWSWLSDRQIADGVVLALDDAAGDVTVVGALDPWPPDTPKLECL